jgi:uncharacterized protein YjcR
VELSIEDLLKIMHQQSDEIRTQGEKIRYQSEQILNLVEQLKKQDEFIKNILTLKPSSISAAAPATAPAKAPITPSSTENKCDPKIVIIDN